MSCVLELNELGAFASLPRREKSHTARGMTTYDLALDSNLCRERFYLDEWLKKRSSVLQIRRCLLHTARERRRGQRMRGAKTGAALKLSHSLLAPLI